MAAVPFGHPSLRRARPILGGEMPSPSHPPSGCRFHTRCPHARPLCRDAEPAFETVAGGRSVACHFWKEIADAGAGGIAAPPPTPAFARRLGLLKSTRSPPMETAS